MLAVLAAVLVVWAAYRLAGSRWLETRRRHWGDSAGADDERGG
jgi:hypothetical protein